MFVRVISIIMLMALLNMIFGCGTWKGFTPNKESGVKNHPKDKISAVILKKTIAGIKRPSGDKIYFDEQGGKYDKNSKNISGVVKGGSNIESKLIELQSVLVKIVSLSGQHIDETSIDNFENSVMEKKWNIVDGQYVREGEVITFDKYGGEFDYEGKVIKGNITLGQYIEIPYEDAFKIKMRPSVKNNKEIINTFIVISLLAAIAAIVLYVEDLPFR